MNEFASKMCFHCLSIFFFTPLYLQKCVENSLFSKSKQLLQQDTVSVSEELTATFCLYDKDKEGGISVTEMSDKIWQVRTIRQ